MRVSDVNLSVISDRSRHDPFNLAMIDSYITDTQETKVQITLENGIFQI
jgi:hypothetical protein